MVEIRQSIPVDEAVRRIMEHVKTGPAERISLAEAQGRFLAEDIVASHDVPFFDRSPVDGFAMKAEDTKAAGPDTPRRLEVVETIGAGYVATRQVLGGKAVRIMTGAPIPEGADAVIMLENVTETLEGKQPVIEITSPVAAGENIIRRGEDMKEGTVLLKAGRQMGAGEIALLATFGYGEINVFQQPVIGVFATGSELVSVDEPLAPGKIRNSNSPMLEAQIRQAGAIPRYYGILVDDFDQSYEAVAGALKEVDYVITTGGVSVGDFDYVPAILDKLQAEVLFNKVEMRPGSVTTVATVGDKWFFGLSGNPSACFVGFELFVRPIVKTYLGSSTPHLHKTAALLTTDLGRRNEFARFVRARLTVEDATLSVTPVGLEKSGIVSSLAEANALLVVPPRTEKLRAGEKVDVICLEVHPGVPGV
ncbi:molybdopterin molybdotransferase MoeA [Alkalihalobacillus oceani]|uniref:molybdopterin molybdotransferase MoeA n=1 Tax=Halalkalibacter oceani TaxID=1653776 RepID=UPI00203D17C9|nr:gephyrin-like molybdotransferase Glp [Halalkalibacter oceani]MCM3760264.1 molybdopterin molybdotransferase MoeA [Halalkalibacter oceani]